MVKAYTDKVCKIQIIRSEYFDDTTIGKMYINGEYFCFTLEDAVRAYGVKVNGHTAISAGIYRGEISMSSRFKRLMLMIFTEDNGYEIKKGGISFKGVRAHGGNSHENTEGCVLIAHKRVSEKIIQGTAEKEFLKKVEGFEEFEINIINEF